MLPGSTRLVLVTALIGATAAVATRMPTIQTEGQANRLPATRLPLRMGQWEGTEIPVAVDVQKALPTAQILSRRYRQPMGEADVTLVSGSDATVLHDPHDCLRGDGWQFVTDQPRSVRLGRSGERTTIRDV